MKYFLGSLESAIMEVLWTRGPATVREVVDELCRRRPLAYTTVMTVMNRLTTDGYLRRTAGTSNSFRYHPRQDRDSFAADCSRSNIHALVDRYGDVALVQFLQALDTLPADKLQRLKRHAGKKNRE